MSFAVSKYLRYSTKSGRIFFFFIPFSFCSALLLFVHLSLFKAQIQKQAFHTVQLALEEHLQESGAFRGGRFSVGTDSHGLDFIRFIKENDQLLLTGRKDFDFERLVDLKPSASGIWIDLQRPDQQGNWILVSLATQEGGFVQGGKDAASSGIALYKEAVSTSLWLLLWALFGSLCLSFGLVYLMERPLRQLEETIREALEKKQFSTPATEDILSPLYELIGKVFYQNRALITEMQSSLDNVAHDLRTPMTRLRAVAEYALQSDHDDSQPYRNALSDCLEESERVLSTLGVMMTVAEAESGTMRLEVQVVNIYKTLEDVIGLYQYVAEDANIGVSLKDNEEQPMAEVDKTRLSQVWANLLDNAIKYGHESGTVLIQIKTEGQRVIVSFIDDGMGISESEINRIWDRLYRGDRSRTKQGLGLGLNYVKAVVEAHGGEVRVTSTIRKGSCFEVHLPLHAEITD